MKKAKKVQAVQTIKIDWELDDAEFLGWDKAPHQGTYWVKGDGEDGKRYSGYLTIVFHGERDEDIVGVEDIEEIYPSPIRNDSIKFAVRLTDDDKYDPNQVHMVTGNELLDYLTRKGKKNNE